MNPDDDSSDTSAVIKEFGLYGVNSSPSSEFDWSVFEDCFTLESEGGGAISGLASPGVVRLPLNHSPRKRTPGRGVRRSRITTKRGRCGLGEEGSSGPPPPGFDANLGFSYAEWEKVFPRLMESRVVIKNEPEN